MKMAKATFGGGCFWCTDAIFNEVDGVVSVESGYSGGKLKDPSYREVCGGRTGHAEVIELTYDPEKVTFRELLSIHLTTHDPTTLNQQGADRGTQYRSIVLYRNEDEKRVSEDVIRELDGIYDSKIVTELSPFEHFYLADEAHQEFYRNNPEAGYCRVVIEPKLRKFRDRYKKTASSN